jgi:hypothetical protein
MWKIGLVHVVEPYEIIAAGLQAARRQAEHAPRAMERLTETMTWNAAPARLQEVQGRLFPRGPGVVSIDHPARFDAEAALPQGGQEHLAAKLRLLLPAWPADESDASVAVLVEEMVHHGGHARPVVRAHAGRCGQRHRHGHHRQGAIGSAEGLQLLLRDVVAQGTGQDQGVQVPGIHHLVQDVALGFHAVHGSNAAPDTHMRRQEALVAASRAPERRACP